MSLIEKSILNTFNDARKMEKKYMRIADIMPFLCE